MITTTVPGLLEIDDCAEVAQLVAVMSLGICVAIAAGGMTIEEAERRLFNPQVLGRLERLGVAEVLVEVVHLGMELEDVRSLVPERLGESLVLMQGKVLGFLRG
jgi:hypothetical protein